MYERQRIAKALIALCVVVASGTLYFHGRMELDWIESLYTVAITLSTVGYSAPPGLDDEGRVFIVLLILLGVGTAAYSISLMVTQIVEGGLANVLESRKMQKQIQTLAGHTIVCGAGRIGMLVVKELRELGRPVVCVDKNADRLADLREDGVLTIEGDSTEEQVLERAGIERARVLVAAVPHDAESVYLTLTARFLNRGLRIVARGSDEATERKLKRAGANVVILPNLIGGRRMAQAVLTPHVMDFVDLTTRKGGHDLRLDEVTIPARSTLAGQRLVDSNLRQKYGLIIVAIRKTDGVMRFNPSGETALEDGDILVALGEGSSLDRLKEEVN